MKGRTTYRLMENYPKEVGKFLEKYSDHTPYILGIYAYFIKLNNDLPINKYDLINNGNMGYHGASKYIAEIDEHCQKNQCIFVINDEELNTKKTIQTNRDILKYVVNNYYKIYSSNIYSIYITKKNIAF